MTQKEDKNDNKESIKIITLGNSDVGKSNYILRFTDDVFRQNYLLTTGMDFRTKEVTMKPDNKKYNVILYDTAGQERFKSISLSIIKKVDGVLLLYDITNKVSFESIQNWMNNIYSIKSEDFPVVLLGNKCDLESERKVSKKDGEELAAKYGIEFFETSNKDGINIKEACSKLIEEIIIHKKNKKDNNNIKIKNKNNQNQDNGKCACKK
jgi:small GTP-binding protein